MVSTFESARGAVRCIRTRSRVVPEALAGRGNYMRAFTELREACVALGASDDDLRAVFSANARRVYGLAGDRTMNGA